MSHRCILRSRRGSGESENRCSPEAGARAPEAGARANRVYRPALGASGEPGFRWRVALVML